MAYVSPSGKEYNDSDVEKVGKTTYVKGTSIAVSPKSSGSTSNGGNGSSGGGGNGGKSNNGSSKTSANYGVTGANVGRNIIGGSGGYVTDNLVEDTWNDNSLTSAQKAMISANITANQMGKELVYSDDDIQKASSGMIGWRYNGNYYVKPQGEANQTSISSTSRTGQDGQSYKYRGYGNEPEFGSYALGVDSPLDMQYSWERIGDRQDMIDDTYKFNPAGAKSASAQNITRELSSIIPAALNSGNTIIPASTEQAGYQQSPKWVGNVYPGATWNADTRTITTKNGDTLIEGVDFAINPSDNRAYVIEKQTSGTGGTSAGAYGQGGQTGFATNDPVGQIYQMILNMQNNREEAPVYEQPDYSDLIPKPTKGVAITANAGDTVFTPTVRYNDRVEQIKARADSNAWNQYQSQYNAYQNDRNAEQQMLSNLSSLLPYSTLTYAQQLDQQAQQAAAEQEAIVAMYEQAMDMWKVLGYVPQGLEEILGVPAGTPTSDYSYKQATLALNQYKASKSGSGGGGGATKEPKSTQSELTGALMSAMGHYKTPADYQADLQRNKPQIVALVGTANYNYLFNDAQAAVDAGNAVNPKFVPGTASPIRAMLESI